MDTAEILLIALLLDAVLGEPRLLWDRVPHPAVLMGRLIAAADQRFNVGVSQKLNGTLVVLSLLGGAWGLGHIIGWFGWLPSVVIAAILIAQRSLVDHVKNVERALRLSVEDGRKSVAMIVSRDTKDMTETAVSRSAIESAAENLSDGVIAPAFWFLIAGLPGLLIYKVVNTADSMIGYKTPRHLRFGWAAARLDDVLNWIPARLTAGLIALSYGIITKWSEIRFDAAFHKSPNAGWPESAMARSLGIALAGPRTYDGFEQDFPYVNEMGRQSLSANDIRDAVSVLWRVWALAFGATLLIALL